MSFVPWRSVMGFNLDLKKYIILASDPIRSNRPNPYIENNVKSSVNSKKEPPNRGNRGNRVRSLNKSFSSIQEFDGTTKVKLRTIEEGTQINLFPKQTLTHRARCDNCGVNQLIAWMDVPGESRKQLCCIKCETQIDIYTAKQIN